MAATESTAAVTTTAPVSGIVAMIHVANVERSVEFYRLLGFEVGNYVPKVENCPIAWAWLYQPNAPNWKTGANLMVTLTGRPLNPGAQDILFYLYANDMVAVRNQLIAAGVKVGEIGYPEYLPKGEFRTSDPDGYTLMIAQSIDGSP